MNSPIGIILASLMAACPGLAFGQGIGPTTGRGGLGREIDPGKELEPEYFELEWIKPLPSIDDAWTRAALDPVLRSNRLSPYWASQPRVEIANLLGSGLPRESDQSLRLLLRADRERVYGDDDVRGGTTPNLPEEVLDKYVPKTGTPPPDKKKVLADLLSGVCLLVPTKNVKNPTSFPLVHFEKYGVRYNLCEETHPDFTTISVTPSGSGFLVGDRHLLTAAHCVDQLGSSLTAVFDFVDPNALTTTGTFVLLQKPQLVDVKSISARSGPSGDWALLELQRPINARHHFTPADRQAIEKGTDLCMIGHPGGMPVKVATRGKAAGATKNGAFYCNLDAFIGNSGSPVLNRSSLELEGILVEGGSDFYLKEKWTGDCNEWVYVSDKQAGEKVTDVSAFAAALKKHLN